MSNKIFVSQPSLPKLNDYNFYLKKIWKSKILTHNGPFVRKLEEKLINHLSVRHLVAVNSGTSAIQAAIRALDLNGEIITTPFTWIATIDSILWERCKPVFVDVDKNTFNIDVSKIEKKITKNTQAILGVHTFSNPCDVLQIQQIARRNKLKVIYDAAHSMFVRYKGKSILEYGDISAVSFHATKIFNTFEGGACITNSSKLAKTLQKIRFFGYDDAKKIQTLGINLKMTEAHAAMGIANLKNAKKNFELRKSHHQLYMKLLSNNQNINFQMINEKSYNYSYMPIIIINKNNVNKLIKKLNKYNIFPRRYFYPSLNKIKIIKDKKNFPISEYLSDRILCLPMYSELKRKDIQKISEIVNENI
tara:strand:- start:1442 stop:2527 length:1086 start_codon:yes stop_codon:yes gene_type:complete